ncbi:hypothetical protein KXJ72_17750 (plasmid) [Comamonas aquatica]|nr:hypothetical protein KXJ72_17750 [Comamonas aquatica]
MSNSYSKKWDDPDFREIANFLVENGVKMPLLVRIGLIKSGEESLFQRYIRLNHLTPMRGRQATSVSLKDSNMRRHLLTALRCYHRQDLTSASKENNLARAIVTAYRHFCLLHNIEEVGTKLTLDRFILAVTSQEMSNIVIDTCPECSAKYIRSTHEVTETFGCTSCELEIKPIFTSKIAQQNVRKYG